MTESKSMNSDRQYTISEEENLSSKDKKYTINVTVEWIENLDPCKVKEITVKVEFMNNILVASDPIPVKKGKVEVYAVGAIQTEEVNLNFLDNMISNPVLITVTNSPVNLFPVTPSSKKGEKDVKKKTSKSSGLPLSDTKSSTTNQNLLGMCNLDITDLLMGKKTIRECLLLDSDKKVPPMGVIPWVKLAKLWVNATTEDWNVFNEASKKMTNLFGITMESVYNVPNYVSEGTIFEARVLVPSLGNRSNMVVFPNGVVTLPKEADAKKRWLTVPQFDGSGARTNRCIYPVKRDVIDTLNDEEELDNYVQKTIPVIQWNMWRNSVMIKSDNNYFYSKLNKHRVWPVEIYSIIKQKENAQKSAKSEKKTKSAVPTPIPTGDHFLTFINLSALLYPGVTKTRVAAQLFTFSQLDLTSKFGPEHPSLIQESQQFSQTPSKSKISDRSKTSIRDNEDTKTISGSPVISENGYPVFVIVEVELFKPLTPKQDPEFLLNSLKSYVSLKGEIKKKTGIKAEEKFSNAVKSMVSTLSDEYERFCQEPESQETSGFQKEFEDFLCRRENFYKVKVTLENQVIELINDKFGPLSQCDDIPDMYIYLVEKIHKITNCCLLKQEDVVSIFNIDDFQLFAEEAIEEGEYERAKSYLYQKLSHRVTNPNYWLDCAVYYNILDQTELAIEAVREALYLDFDHQLALFMYAILMERIKDLTACETAFKVLLLKYPDFMEGWLGFWLYCYVTGNTEGMFVGLQMAKKLNFDLNFGENVQECESKVAMPVEEENENQEEGYLRSYPPENKYIAGESKYGIGSFVNAQSLSEPLAWTPRFSPPNCMYIRMAVFMMRLGFYEYASMCLTQYIYPNTSSKKKVPYYHYYQAVNNYLLGRYYEAIPHLQTFVKDYGRDCFVWGLLGHCYYKLQNHSQAIACYEYVIEAYNRPADIHLIFLRMANYYLKAKKYPCAKKVLLTACKYSPSPKLWKGLGIACLRMEDPEEAEIAFTEANYLDNKDPETWAYLALTNSLLGRVNLFKNCFDEAKKRKLQNADLMVELESCTLLNWLDNDDSISFK